MAQGPMSVGAEAAINFLTDKTLTKEDIAADAEVVGKELGKKYNAAGGVLGGDMEFPELPYGPGDPSKKIVWKMGHHQMEIYAKGDSAAGSPDVFMDLIINMVGDGLEEIRFAHNGEVKSTISSDGKFYGNVFGTAFQATNAENADKVDGIHFAHAGSTNLTQMLAFAGIGSDGNWNVGYRELDDIYKAELDQDKFEDYIKFKNGMLVCWGVGQASGSVVFPHAFCHTDYALQVTPIVDVLHDFYVTGRSTTGFSMNQAGITSTAKTLWTAIGWWKREKRTILDDFKDIVGQT